MAGSSRVILVTDLTALVAKQCRDGGFYLSPFFPIRTTRAAFKGLFTAFQHLYLFPITREGGDAGKLIASFEKLLKPACNKIPWELNECTWWA